MIGLLAAAGLPPRNAAAYPVGATLTADAANSSMTVTVAVPSFGLSDTDVQDLTGTIDAVFDFGTSGAFPSAADVTVLNAHLEPEAAFALTLGIPPFGVNVTIADAVVRVTTPNPPATMTRTMDPGVVYEFDASSFVLTIDEGTVTATGLVNDTIDLSQEPISGPPDPGLVGSLTFTAGATSGPYTLVNVVLELPIDLSDTVAVGTPPTNVDVSVNGTLHANGSFYVALSGVPGDFDEDGDVDGDDLPVWSAGFGMAAGADPGDGDADGDDDVDGADFLVWQQNAGIAPPAVPAMWAAAVAPEPSAGVLAVIAATAASRGRNRRLAHC